MAFINFIYEPEIAIAQFREQQGDRAVGVGLPLEVDPVLPGVLAHRAAGDREIGVHVDRVRASQYGFNAQQVASFVAVALVAKTGEEPRWFIGSTQPSRSKARQSIACHVIQELNLLEEADRLVS